MAKTKLHQIIAVIDGKKTRVQAALTDIYKKMQSGATSTAIIGNQRTYQPVDEGGESLPAEYKHVQQRVGEFIDIVKTEAADLYDDLLTQDVANTKAFASVIVDGKILLKDVPVTSLMYLDKRVIELRNIIEVLPTLDPQHEWEYNTATACWSTKPVKTIRTKKVPCNHVKFKGDKDHPPQVEMYHEDRIIGHYTSILFSGAIPQEDKRRMLAQVNKVLDAIKVARTEANNVEVDAVKQSKVMLDFIFDLGAKS